MNYYEKYLKYKKIKPIIYKNPKVLFNGSTPTIIRTGTNQAVCF